LSKNKATLNAKNKVRMIKKWKTIVRKIRKKELNKTKVVSKSVLQKVQKII
jgi:hypothetical protein